MRKKTVFVCVADHPAHIDAVREVMGIGFDRFERMFEIVTVAPVAAGTKRAPKLSPSWYADGDHDCVVAIGRHTASYLGVQGAPNSVITAVKGGRMRMFVLLDDPVWNPKSYTHPRTRAGIVALLEDLATINAPPVTYEDARQVISIVTADPGAVGYFTNKIVTEIESKIAAGKDIDRWDLVQLTECWANDIKIGGSS